ncbi:hypothetical protein CA11_40330 [Gimesia maris]|uniref:Flp family type IVb pilin n=1 Tax=Gimesia maris TaxID=122 RepID=UPI00118B5E9F|nr:hypothetical protein [Gimesia maris]QDU16204.1 hypothetical protein CA11_40330 [Gimesia maris]
MLLKLRRVLKSKKGQGLVEYGILVGGVALVTLAAVAVLGHKTNDLVATVAAVLPGAHADDNAPIVSGKLVKTTDNGGSGITLDVTNPGSFASNLGITGIDSLVIEPEDLP